MQGEIKARTSEELKSFWNDFEAVYSSHMENDVFSIYPILVNLLKVKELFKSQKDLRILELSIGSGEGLHYLLSIAKLYNISNKKITIQATDIAPKMLEEAFEKFKHLSFIGLNYKGEQVLELKDINVYLSEANNEKLPFEDNQFDLVISNLSLHLVTNPDAMLKECSRVTKKDCYNTFSVWGKKEDSKYFTFYDEVLKKVGLYEEPKVRSNFHLGQNDEELKKMVLSSGYARVNLSHSFIPFGIVEIHDYDYFFTSPYMKNIIASVSSEKAAELKDEIYKAISEILDKNGLIGLDALIILCKKN
jgi:ubiquinone/menaquinone biosynthesis C-methylase UbiE